MDYVSRRQCILPIGPIARLSPSVLPQRIVIATLATLIDYSYEETAALLGIHMDPRTRLPILPVGGGVNPLQLTYPLWQVGWKAIPFVTRTAENVSAAKELAALPTVEEIKALLPGRLALLGYVDADPAVGPHALAWDGEQAIDCSDQSFVSLDAVPIDFALVLERISQQAHSMGQ